MAMPGNQNSLHFRVVEDSVECGHFVINVCCDEPRLLHFWRRKPAFSDGQVDQVNTRLQTGPQMDFLLLVRHRASNLPNSHYWLPFVLTLCLDALHFGFRLPPQAHSGGGIRDVIQRHGELVLLRLEPSN